ncbi:hypothetical protein EUX98_g3804 [Antrodiella citrinella]|uniref:Uncharacterized protein n=1 Tax=Antrodiella citrinella TaxID=2447956 RepID=A0A4S4MVN0_9APHY|nr:hypothetical protein EUX98_g3804 [Antrodiella citrinella]
MPYFDLSPSHHAPHTPGLPDTPGSSVFDLPTQQHREGRSTQLTPVQSHHDAGCSASDTSFVVVSGGTGCNSIVSAFGNACYVLPVSDDGGSSSEIIRVLGGPSIGDIRSRLVRLIPPAAPSSTLDRIRNLLAYRLPAQCTEREARDEWRDIVEGRSTLWSGIPNDRKEMIRGLFYLNAYGNEIYPSPNPDYLHNLGEKDVLIYSCGSLWTSIIPCLALRGVASAIARSRSLRAKILLLNAQNDRETDGYTAIDYISTITRTLNAVYQPQSYGGLGGVATTYPVSAFITHIVYLKNTAVEVDVGKITTLGVSCVEVEGPVDERNGRPKFDANCVRKAIERILSEDVV